MILLQVKHYIRQHHEVSVRDIENHFDLSSETVDAMLQRLEQQGYIQRLTNQACSTGQCHDSCNSDQSIERVLWRDKCFISLSIPVEVR